MEYSIGIVLAVVVFGFARWTGFDRGRTFYPTLVIVVASYYLLFAALGGSWNVVLVESIAVAVFVSMAVIGFKVSAWWVVAGLAGHGVFDALHGHIVTNPGVPEWWPAFCLTFDVGAAGLLALIVVRDSARRRVAHVAS